MVGLFKKKSKGPVNKDLVLLTTEVLPDNLKLRGLFPMIEIHGTILISKKSLLKRMFTRNKNERQELIEAFASYAPEEANAIIGVRTSSSTALFTNGTYLIVTYSGTPAIIENCEG